MKDAVGKKKKMRVAFKIYLHRKSLPERNIYINSLTFILTFMNYLFALKEENAAEEFRIIASSFRKAFGLKMVEFLANKFFENFTLDKS